jgi:hypothetical protein
MRNPEPTLEPALWHRRFCAITPWLALSGDLDTTVASNAERQLTEWVDNGVTHIVDLRGEWNDDEFVAEYSPVVSYHWLGTHDSGGHQTDEWYEDGLEVYRSVRAADGCAMVHCHMGINRGPSMGFRWLLEAGIDPVEALDLIRGARPIAGIIYADSALDHFHRTTGVDSAVAAVQREEVREWFRNDTVDVSWVISRVRQAESY